MTPTPASRRTWPASLSALSTVEGKTGDELNTDTRSWIRSLCPLAAEAGHDPRTTKAKPKVPVRRVEGFMAAPLGAAKIAVDGRIPQCNADERGPKSW